VRATPGITCALVGTRSVAHVEENAAVARVAPAA
jgi:aryl-alcohol dehydrogenase-like predicted oxidoreductase